MAMKGLSKQEIEARMNQQKTLLVQNMGAPQREGLNKLKAIIRIYKGYILKTEKGKGNSHWDRLPNWKQQNLHQLRICFN